MQVIIDYIEDHLMEKIELKDLSKLTGYSVPHIYRIFNAMVGYSVMAYVRKRRLSNALYDLVTTDKSIIDIAFDYGYESHEAFTRTFKTAYGAPPRSLRKAQTEPILFERIQLLSQPKNKGEYLMKPEIICKDGILLIGKTKFISGPEDKKYDQLLETRKELIEDVAMIPNRINKKQYYAAYDYLPEDMEKDDDDISYTYYYCVEVSDTNIVPEGMIKKEIPQGKYAVFNYDNTNNTLNGETLESDVYDFIDGVWLPDSGFELSDQPDYEVINKEDQTIDYYISIL